LTLIVPADEAVDRAKRFGTFVQSKFLVERSKSFVKRVVNLGGAENGLPEAIPAYTKQSSSM
jgi:hypothetical protein